MYIHEEYDFKVISKKTFADDVRIEMVDLVKIFKAFSVQKILVPALRDKLLVIME